ncbi:FAD-dependent monooxygenase [Streptomyces sp. NPDC092296]|uniref:FAD-dependent monooxygenase n=1 Tax=Streptomyces sp. NPDC092296 TaxID=3366012 RepID=UPI00380E87BD
MPDRTSTTDVLIAGAGPTGLLLAGDLAAAGVGVTVLERRTAESGLTRAFAVHARTLEQLDARGLADELIATGTALSSLRFFGQLRIDLSQLRSRFPFVLITPQYNTERVLERRALAAGARILRDAEVTGLRQDPDGVELDVRDGSGGTATHRARYAVGADGVRSAVRQLLDLPFPGESVVSSMMLADVRLTHPPGEVLLAAAGRGGFGLLVPFGDGWYRAIAWNRHHRLPDDAPVDLAELREVLRRTLGDDYGMGEARWTSRFHSDERQVSQYRSGRVFLAGDAAHCHSPAGGQGMNTGLQDAVNLGWKLAAAVHGHAPAGLLDSYHAERHPVGRKVLRSSGALIRFALAGSTAAGAPITALVRLGSHLRPVTRRATRQVSGIGIAYPAPRGAHPLTGRRVPDLRLTGPDGTPQRLYEALRTGRSVLVGRSPEAARPWADRLLPATPAGGPATTLLVRPDGYTAWAADSPAPATLHTALTTHLGPPAGS